MADCYKPVVKMAAKRRHQNTSAPENGRTKQSLQVSGKAKPVKKRDKENGHACEDVTRPVTQWSKAYMTLVAGLGELFTSDGEARLGLDGSSST